MADSEGKVYDGAVFVEVCAWVLLEPEATVVVDAVPEDTGNAVGAGIGDEAELKLEGR